MATQLNQMANQIMKWLASAQKIVFTSAYALSILLHNFSIAHFAEAKLEEVLDSLRLRIRSLFTWAKSEVSGFDDLSPLDQKALLRRTVPELVMLGFARGSIAYTGGLGLQ